MAVNANLRLALRRVIFREHPEIIWIGALAILGVIAGTALKIALDSDAGMVLTSMSYAAVFAARFRFLRARKRILARPSWCRGCGYAMGDQDPCPECGRAAGSEDSPDHLHGAVQAAAAIVLALLLFLLFIGLATGFLT